jgi:hypothetical protein
MALSPADAARLSSLFAARDSLISVVAVAEVEYAGQRTVYAKADLARLDREIQELQTAAASPTGRTRGAIRFRL